MPLDASQIGVWLKAVREAAGMTQLETPEKSGVGYGVVTSAEQGRDVLTTNFLALVAAYRAEDALAALIKEWRRGAPLRRVAEPGMQIPISRPVAKKKKGA